MSVMAIALFALIAVLLGGGLALALHLARPRIAAIREALARCPDRLEMRYTLVETVVGWNDGSVIPFPLRPAAGSPPLRAAA